MLSRVQNFSCPVCGNHIGEAQPIERVIEGDMTKQQRLILETMQPHVGAWVSVEQIERALWNSTDRKSRNPSSRLISVQITNLRDKLIPCGWMIKGDRRGRYKLIPTGSLS